MLEISRLTKGNVTVVYANSHVLPSDSDVLQ